MAYSAERYHTGSEYGAVARSYIVSEVESPRPWRDEIDEDSLNVEEIFIAPPGSRRPQGYPRGLNYHGMKNRTWSRAPPPTPSTAYPDAEYEYDGIHHHDEEVYGYPPTYRAKGAYRPGPLPLSDSSSICSSDCDECAYTEPRSQYRQRQPQRQSRRTAAPIPQVVVPRGRIGPAPALSPVPQPPAYTHDPPRVFRLQNSTDLEEGIGGHASSVEPFNPDIASNPHNQLVVFEGTGTERAYSDASPLHSNVSSPRWSMANQRYISGSEGHSDKSQSPAISFDGRNLYEQPDPRFAYHGQPPRIHRGHPPPVVITRSSDGLEHEFPRQPRYPKYGYRESEDRYSGSDSGYCSNEGSFSGSSNGDYYDRRKYW